MPGGPHELDARRRSRPARGAETRQALRFVERILSECDATLADIVKVSVFMTDLAEWDAMNEAYLDVLGSHTPARIAVGCASLLFGAKVEFDCVAVRGT
jgi:2-iminobutanoate/2-iminopropanoate deaminase